MKSSMKKKSFVFSNFWSMFLFFLILVLFPWLDLQYNVKYRTDIFVSSILEKSVQFLNAKYDMKLQNFTDAIYHIKEVPVNLWFSERFNQVWMLDFFKCIFFQELRESYGYSLVHRYELHRPLNVKPPCLSRTTACSHDAMPF